MHTPICAVTTARFYKVRFAIVTTFLFCSLVSLIAPRPAGAQDYVTGEVLVGIKPDQDDAAAARRLADTGTILRYTPELHYYRLKLNQGITVQAAISALKARSEVRYAEPNYFVYGTGGPVPNDTYFTSTLSTLYATDKQYAPQRVQADLAWNIWQPRRQVVIAILDTGIDSQHPDLANKILRNSGLIVGYNALTRTAGDAADNNGHGTINAGIAAAQINNGIGIAGIAGWNGQAGTSDVSIKLMPVKVLDQGSTRPELRQFYGQGTNPDLEAGIRWAADHGANIISMSLVNYGANGPVNDALWYAWGRGCLLVASAGNNGSNVLSYPAAYSNVISVTASDKNDVLTEFSEYGSWVTTAAPGNYILCTLPTTDVTLNHLPVIPDPIRPIYPFSRDYDFASGMSQACPHVSGEAALIWSQNPNLTNQQVRNLILSYTDPVTPYPGQGGIGGGRINVYRALLAAGGARVVGDYNSDGWLDLTFQNQTNGQLTYWLLNGTTVTITGGFTGAPAPDPNWKVVGIGDLNASGNPGLLFQYTPTGQVGYWFLNGTTYLSSGGFANAPSPSDPNWKVVAVGDLNGDGKPDLVLQHQVSGEIGYWLLNGTTVTAIGGFTGVPAPNPDWKVVGLGDFNGDGFLDLALQHAPTGQVGYWLLNGTTYLSSGSFTAAPAPNPDWKVVGVGDLNTDGWPDLLVQHAPTGQVGYWLLNGTTYLSSGGFANAPAPSANMTLVTPR